MERDEHRAAGRLGRAARSRWCSTGCSRLSSRELVHRLELDDLEAPLPERQRNRHRLTAWPPNSALPSGEAMETGTFRGVVVALDAAEA